MYVRDLPPFVRWQVAYMTRLLAAKSNAAVFDIVHVGLFMFIATKWLERKRPLLLLFVTSEERLGRFAENIYQHLRRNCFFPSTGVHSLSERMHALASCGSLRILRSPILKLPSEQQIRQNQGA